MKGKKKVRCTSSRTDIDVEKWNTFTMNATTSSYAPYQMVHKKNKTINFYSLLLLTNIEGIFGIIVVFSRKGALVEGIRDER